MLVKMQEVNVQVAVRVSDFAVSEQKVFFADLCLDASVQKLFLVVEVLEIFAGATTAAKGETGRGDELCANHSVLESADSWKRQSFHIRSCPYVKINSGILVSFSSRIHVD